MLSGGCPRHRGDVGPVMVGNEGLLGVSKACKGSEGKCYLWDKPGEAESVVQSGPGKKEH